eukprot:m.37271 g.37271  ORF g.37271 m.37271 type:complete len:412 (+) comp12490_c0_seq1:218-1453(+)
MNHNLLKRLQGFYLRQERCDVVLRVAGQKIHCHSLILAAASEYFDAMFAVDSPWHEASMQEVELQDVDLNAVQSIIDYVYSNDITMTEDNVIAVLHAACLLRVEEVVAQATLYLEQHIDQHNVIALLGYSHRYGLDRLQQRATQIIKRSFGIVCCQEAFAELGWQTLQLLLELPGLAIPSELMLLNALLRWLHHDLATRLEHAPDLFQHVRLRYIAPQQLHEIRAAQRSQGVSIPAITPDLNIPSRTGTIDGMMVVVGGFSSLHGRCRSVEMYDAITKSWRPLPPLEVPRSYLGLACCRGQIYAYGGYSGGFGLQGHLTVASAECFDPLTSTWSAAPALSNQRARFGSVSHGDYIYALGGVNAFERPLNSVERLNVTEGVWQSIAPLPRPVCDAAAAVLNDKIYVCGGRAS